MSESDLQNALNTVYQIEGLLSLLRQADVTDTKRAEITSLLDSLADKLKVEIQSQKVIVPSPEAVEPQPIITEVSNDEVKTDEPVIYEETVEPVISEEIVDIEEPAISKVAAEPAFTNDEEESVFTDDEIEPLFTDDDVEQTITDDEIEPAFTDDEVEPVFSDDEVEPTFTDDETTPIIFEDDTPVIDAIEIPVVEDDSESAKHLDDTDFDDEADNETNNEPDDEADDEADEESVNEIDDETDEEAVAENAIFEEEADADIDDINYLPDRDLNESAFVASIGSKLRNAFTLNDKFRFRRELFGNSDREFADTLNLVEAMKSRAEAEDYFYNELGWDPENEDVTAFMRIVNLFLP